MGIYKKIILAGFVATGIISMIFIKINTEKEWGAYTGDSVSSFINFQQKVGKQADLRVVFTGWHEPLPVYENDSAVNSHTTVIFWEQYNVTLDEIISGSSDEYIKQFAAKAKNYKNPIIIAPLHEMNGEWNPWSGAAEGNSPEKVIEAWRHIRNAFGKADNVKWAFAVNNESVPDTEKNQIENYYPGDEYVDYVGVDGFNFGDPWQTYSEIFSPSLEKLRKYSKPIYIFSMASAEGPGKADWIKNALSRIKSDPDIKGWIWFNQNKEKNWLVWSDESSLSAFRDAIK